MSESNCVCQEMIASLNRAANSSKNVDDYVSFSYMTTSIRLGYSLGLNSNCTAIDIHQHHSEGETYGLDLARLRWSVYEVILPLLIATGILTNVLDLVVLSRPSMRGSSYRYLARLALSDLLYLAFNIPFCFQEFLHVIRNQPVSRASAIYYSHVAIPIVNVFLTMSIYIVVWLSYDRCIAVCSPHKFSARQRLEVVNGRTAISFLMTLIIYIPSPLRQTFVCTDQGCCVFDSGILSNKWYVTYEFVREIYSRFLPAVAITGFNMAIIIALRHATKVRREREMPDVINGVRQDREKRLVILLLAITVLFYVSTLPSALYKIIHKHTLAFFPYFRAVADILEVSGHVFNFVLYFLFSPEFRKTLISLHGNPNNMAMTSSIVQA